MLYLLSMQELTLPAMLTDVHSYQRERDINYGD